MIIVFLRLISCTYLLWTMPCYAYVVTETYCCIDVSAACQRSTGPSLRQLRVHDDVAVDEDSNCCSMIDVTTATSASQQHAAVMTSQTDTGYQSNILQTTAMHDGALSAGIQYIHGQHNVEIFDRSDDLWYTAAVTSTASSAFGCRSSGQNGWIVIMLCLWYRVAFVAIAILLFCAM